MRANPAQLFRKVRANPAHLAPQNPDFQLFLRLARSVPNSLDNRGGSLLSDSPPQTRSRQKALITTMKSNRRFMTAAVAALLFSGIAQALGQDNPGPPQGRPNFDPAQFQQRRLERIKEQMEITDDSEWKAMEPLVQKVMEARMASMAGMGRGMFGGPRRGGGNNQGDQAQGQRRGMFGTPSPEAEALQKAIDAKAPKAEIKAALAKFVESRKAKQAELEKAQEELRKVLTTRQEAIATLEGLL